MENNILNEQAIKEAINAIRPALQNDGGDIEFIKYDAENKNVHVKLVGACAGCPMSQLTLTNGVQRYVRETVDKDITVINDNQLESISTTNGKGMQAKKSIPFLFSPPCKKHIYIKKPKTTLLTIKANPSKTNHGSQNHS